MGLLALAGCAANAPTFAQTRDIEPRLSVRVGAATTDNLGRQPADDAQSETFATTGIDIGFLRETPRARAHADGTIDYYAYNSDEFSNETSGTIDSGLSLYIVPELFSWDFSERIDHARIDPFLPAGPENRERVNFFSTGPRAAIALGDSSSLNIVGQYVDRGYRESDALDGSTRAVALELARDLSEGQRLGLVFENQDIQFDGPLSLPYEIQEAYLTYERRTASEGSFSVSGGTNRLRGDQTSESEPYFQLEWARNLTPRSAVSFGGGRGFESPSDYFDAGTLGGAAGGIDDTLLTPEARMITDMRLTYTLTRPRAVFRVREERIREEYGGGGLLQERDVSQRSVGLEYRFTPLLIGSMELGSSSEEFVASGTADEDRAQATLRRRLGRAWEGSLSFEYAARDYDLGISFTERRYILSLLWSPIRPAARADTPAAPARPDTRSAPATRPGTRSVPGTRPGTRSPPVTRSDAPSAPPG